MFAFVPILMFKDYSKEVNMLIKYAGMKVVYDEPNPDGSDDHIEITAEDIVTKYREYYDNKGTRLNRPLLTDDQLIEEIAIINWGSII
jgi:hypothetical protein